MPEQRPERRVSMQDIASAAGVSVPTVSRALAGRGELPAATRVRIQMLARQLGYNRGTSPRGRPATTDTRMIELVLGTFDDGWTDEVAIGARQGAAREGFDLVLTLERSDPSDDWPRRVAARRSAGVILGLIRPTRSQLAELRGLNIPIVLLEPGSEGHGEFASIGTTDRAGAYDVGSLLVERGLRDFVLVVGEPRYRFGRAREEGFRAAIEERAPEAKIEAIRGDWQETDLTAKLRPLLDPTVPTGVFATNDAMAIGVYKAAARLGLQIPAQVSVVGFDDISRAAMLSPPLTTVRQPVREIAAQAVQMIQRLRRGSVSDTERVEIPTHLVVRGSVQG